MKKFKQTALVTMMSLLIFSCKKSSTNQETTNPPANAYTFKLDGSEIKVDSARATLYTLGVAPFGRMIDVYAFKGGVQMLEFHFRPVTGEVTADGTFTNAWLTLKTGQVFPTDYYNSISGKLTVTQCDTINKKVVCGFNFVGSNGSVTKNITDGNLTVDITQVQ
ncbi:MAG: hypothetical protein KA198_00200 [Chitinophagaceae bacterium]|nr:hypothetical protein [Chitinophagaceae bacterium]